MQEEASTFHCYVVVVVLTLTRIIIKSVVTGQAPVTLELRNTPMIDRRVKVTKHTMHCTRAANWLYQRKRARDNVGSACYIEFNMLPGESRT